MTLPHWPTLSGTPPFLAAHRGDPLLYPENTLSSYHAAILLGADYVETDLILTKDGVLVCHHNLHLSKTTDVALRPEFAERHRKLVVKVPEGDIPMPEQEDWFMQDFTQEEIQQLKFMDGKIGVRVREVEMGGKVSTFEAFLERVRELSNVLKRPIGLVLDIKRAHHHNSYFPSSNGHYMEDKILELLSKYGFDQANSTFSDPSRIILESAEAPCLEYFQSLNLPYQRSLLVIMNWKYLTPVGLDKAKSVAHRICLYKLAFRIDLTPMLLKYGIKLDADTITSLGGLIPPEALLQEIHIRGLFADAFTFRDKHEWDVMLDGKWESREEELTWNLKYGLDGLFVEGMAEAIKVRDIVERTLKEEQEVAAVTSVLKN